MDCLILSNYSVNVGMMYQHIMSNSGDIPRTGRLTARYFGRCQRGNPRRIPSCGQPDRALANPVAGAQDQLDLAIGRSRMVARSPAFGREWLR